jgi:hypothetical protein
MVRVYSKALDSSLETDRIIGRIDSEEGPTVIFVGGIHGNEPSGVFALEEVFETISSEQIPVRGSFIGIAGNLWALQREERFHSEDLNRLWTLENVDALENQNFEVRHADHQEQVELFHEITQLIATKKGPFYFVDLHTTSGPSIPFLTVSDSLLNRTFCELFPVPMVLGIEEYLNGALLSYLNELGYVSFGFEGGQHDDIDSIKNHKAFIYLTLLYAGALDFDHVDYQVSYNQLANSARGLNYIYEILSRYWVEEEDHFKMKPGIVNFQRVNKYDQMATHNDAVILAERDGRILMPRYYNQGNDGFFFIRRISAFALRLSSRLRRIRFNRVLPLLPGVDWNSKVHETLLVNKNVARFFTKQFFHLMGYRSRTLDKHHFIMKNREAASKTEEYPHSRWKNIKKELMRAYKNSLKGL